jgi:hypothetical protein
MRCEGGLAPGFSRSLTLRVRFQYFESISQESFIGTDNDAGATREQRHGKLTVLKNFWVLFLHLMQTYI